MISKHITTKPQNDNYGRLANYMQDARRHHDRTAEYISDAEHQGEKVLHRWHCGCEADTYELAISEVQATQSCNTRSNKEKTYHLVVSFRPEDETRLNEDAFREIERTFAEALGFTDHQRHCGVHKNTGNIHLHIAYNMIHPTKFTRQEPYRDYAARDRACRELERRFGLEVDNGRTRDAPVRGNDRARVIEAHTGQQSFDGYIQERRESILEGIARSATWADVHQALARHGLEIQLRGNGCILSGRQDTKGNRRIKASSLARELSKAALESRFGVFTASLLTAVELDALEQARFDARPLQRGPERGEMFKEYQEGIEQRKNRLEAIHKEKEARESTTRKRWTSERKQLAILPLTRADRTKLLLSIKMCEMADLETIRRDITAQRQAVRKDVPFWNWVGFLTLKAEAGNEMALAILRSRSEAFSPEQRQQAAPPSAPESIRELRAEWRQKRQDIQQRSELTSDDRQQLLAVSRMYQLAAEDRLNGVHGMEEFTWRVDGRGTVLFTLPSGGLVRDSGKDLTFSAHDPEAQKVAERLAALKFGRLFSQEANKLYRKQSLQRDREPQKQGLER